MARPAICTEIIPAACERVGVTLDQITENAQVRVSVNSIAELRAQVSAATDVFGAHATVGPFVRELAALFRRIVSNLLPTARRHGRPRVRSFSGLTSP